MRRGESILGSLVPAYIPGKALLLLSRRTLLLLRRTLATSQLDEAVLLRHGGRLVGFSSRLENVRRRDGSTFFGTALSLIRLKIIVPSIIK